MSEVIVFGETAVDILIVPDIESIVGDRIRGTDYKISCGGMGANQAIVACKLGVSPHFVTRVTRDEYGTKLHRKLLDAGIQPDGILVSEGITPLAIIALSASAQNRILAFMEGINGDIDDSDVERFTALMSTSRVALFQLGYPVKQVAAAIVRAKAAGITTILDPVFRGSAIPRSLYPSIDILTPNNEEVRDLVGFTVNTEQDAVRAATMLHDLGLRTLIINAGVSGVFCSSEGTSFMIPALKVHVRDSVGAGDAFNAGLAVAIVKGYSMREAVALGNATAAISLSGIGVWEANITWDSVLNQLKTAGAYPVTL